ncbi:hypothetical protein [Paenibacillus qinlingensis]|uniref:Uncharacterized protein n=1 Tax=Paenibacillus qinlingensis TaxID=1837343 RepID=A0ABU1NVQ3_9BACL|nr:hypothetical protein [Paenibacillus qinlingensis]MDR6551551.1 hypothetical protein [Paenibacillus qinlingensis]
MKSRIKTIKGISIGIIISALLTSGVANASNGGNNIIVFYKQLKYKINGEMRNSLLG